MITDFLTLNVYLPFRLCFDLHIYIVGYKSNVINKNIDV